MFKDVGQLGPSWAEVASIASASEMNRGVTASFSPGLYNTSMVVTTIHFFLLALISVTGTTPSSFNVPI